MRIFKKVAMVLAFAFVISLPADAQNHHASGSNGNSGSSGPGSAGSAASSSSSSSASTSSSVMVSNSQNSDYRGANHGISEDTRSFGGYVAPSPQYSSFTSSGIYWNWQEFFYRLQNEYLLNPSYMHRFMVNREPLLTPSLLRIAVWKPLRLSSTLMSKLDDLDATLRKIQGGEKLDKEQITLQIRAIRKITKQISNSGNWDLIDQRKDKDILKGMQLTGYLLEDSARLRDIATDLNAQLRNWYNSSSTSTISAASLTQPSIESLTKGIEKISKAMENNIKRM